MWTLDPGEAARLQAELEGLRAQRAELALAEFREYFGRLDRSENRSAIYLARRTDTSMRIAATYFGRYQYDYTHGQSDSLERITHSICTLEFENHRPLYDWFCRELGIYHPQQIEFARLNLTYTVMSKRKLLQLVGDGHVCGWDDPRLPTISGMRRRGYPLAALREFVKRAGVTKKDKLIEMSMLAMTMSMTSAKRTRTCSPNA